MNETLIFLSLFVIELLLLFYFSRLVIKSLGQILFRLTKSHRGTIWGLAFLFLPGTVIHELAHAITAGVLMVHVGTVEMMPEIHEDGIKLGSAQIGRTDPIRRALIGVAPVLVGLCIILGMMFLVGSSLKTGLLPFWGYLVIIYLLFEISNTMFSSKKDMEGFSIFLVLLLSIVIGFYLLSGQQFFSGLEILLNQDVAEFFKAASLLMLIPIIIDLATFGLASLILKR
jgi:hypothetical protein